MKLMPSYLSMPKEQLSDMRMPEEAEACINFFNEHPELLANNKLLSETNGYLMLTARSITNKVLIDFYADMDGSRIAGQIFAPVKSYLPTSADHGIKRPYALYCDLNKLLRKLRLRGETVLAMTDLNDMTEIRPLAL